MGPTSALRSSSSSAETDWKVYILLCSDRSLYTGITTDIQRRLSQHQNGTGAKYFRGRAPEALVYLETGHCRSSASRREAALKKLPAVEKRLLVAQPLSQTRDTDADLD